MIQIWTSDPSNGGIQSTPRKFSSYYQYDPTSKKMVRIRLELDRSIGSGNTQVMEPDERLVGFTTVDDLSSNVDLVDTGRGIEYQSSSRTVQLESSPSVGLYVYDQPTDGSSMHPGNKVGAKSNWPADIDTIHLTVLSNDAVIKDQGYIFTNKSATEDQLSLNIKAKVLEVVRSNNPTEPINSFADIQPNHIHTSLTAQGQRVGFTTDEIYDGLKELEVMKIKGNVDTIRGKIVEHMRNSLAPDSRLESTLEATEKALTELERAPNHGPELSQSLRNFRDAKVRLHAEVVAESSLATECHGSFLNTQSAFDKLSALNTDFSAMDAIDDTGVDDSSSDMDTSDPSPEEIMAGEVTA